MEIVQWLEFTDFHAIIAFLNVAKIHLALHKFQENDHKKETKLVFVAWSFGSLSSTHCLELQF